MTGIIDLRSDAVTQPTRRMRNAMATAELGDETFGEDPTVRRLEQLAVAMFGFESAMLCISATMCNLVALMTHGIQGGEVFLDRDVHVIRSEAGGMAAIAGLVPTVIASNRGHILPDALAAALHPVSVLTPWPRLVWLENTHNRGGGSVMPPGDQQEIADIAHARGLRVHLDGARIFNAAAAAGTTLKEATSGVDSVTVDLTKALSCPLGAILLGSQEFMDGARTRRRMLGGGMRQAGIIASCGIIAFEDLVDRVGNDHILAMHIAERLAEIKELRLDPPVVETNIIYADVSRVGTSSEVVRELSKVGVRVSERPPRHIRLVTHHQLTELMADTALRRISETVARMRTN